MSLFPYQMVHFDVNVFMHEGHKPDMKIVLALVNVLNYFSAHIIYLVYTHCIVNAS